MAFPKSFPKGFPKGSPAKAPAYKARGAQAAKPKFAAGEGFVAKNAQKALLDAKKRLGAS